MFEGLGLRDLVYVGMAVGGLFGVWFALKGRVASLEQWKASLLGEDGPISSIKKDITKNDERIRTDFDDENKRIATKLDDVTDDIKALEQHRLKSDTRLTQIESDSAHTRKAVDEMKGDVKSIMQQLTAVATTIATQKKGD